MVDNREDKLATASSASDNALARLPLPPPPPPPPLPAVDADADDFSRNALVVVVVAVADFVAQPLTSFTRASAVDRLSRRLARTRSSSCAMIRVGLVKVWQGAMKQNKKAVGQDVDGTVWYCLRVENGVVQERGGRG